MRERPRVENRTYSPQPEVPAEPLEACSTEHPESLQESRRYKYASEQGHMASTSRVWRLVARKIREVMELEKLHPQPLRELGSCGRVMSLKASPMPWS